MAHLCPSNICSSSFQTKNHQEHQRIQWFKHIKNFLMQEGRRETKRAQNINKKPKKPLSYRHPIRIHRLLPAVILLRLLLMRKTVKIPPLPSLQRMCDSTLEALITDGFLYRIGQPEAIYAIHVHRNGNAIFYYVAYISLHDVIVDCCKYQWA